MESMYKVIKCQAEGLGAETKWSNKKWREAQAL